MKQAGRLTLRGVVDEARFHFQSLRLTTSISTKVGSNEFTWSDEVENIGGRDAIMQMLYHFNIGQPLLQAGARITAPIGTVAPLNATWRRRKALKHGTSCRRRGQGRTEQVYVCDLAADDAGDTRVLVSGLTDGEAVGLQFNKRTLPCFTVWRNTPAEADGYVLGIEPGTNYPNPRSFEQSARPRRVLKPGETWSAAVTATWHHDAAVDRGREQAIQCDSANQGQNSAQPRTEWSKKLAQRIGLSRR